MWRWCGWISEYVDGKCLIAYSHVGPKQQLLSSGEKKKHWIVMNSRLHVRADPMSHDLSPGPYLDDTGGNPTNLQRIPNIKNCPSNKNIIIPKSETIEWSSFPGVVRKIGSQTCRRARSKCGMWPCKRSLPFMEYENTRIPWWEMELWELIFIQPEHRHSEETPKELNMFLTHQ